ncbi:hypothetical protein BTM25_20820 [Actinomadura rubteroloni]|uniref:DUF11 domain-containing protein n=1 Tax=Actinomadura rubteroloni TaxID=1926885 RepID=A0A2P4URM5_9ACTN|nr:hypothetical protein [Actinomadura rubteroloni]POM27664.1 hypothetical protein BTM25_20820 [Actinomadura rubteroloni]
MLSRSTGHRLLLGMGLATVVAATPSPDPSGSGSPTPDPSPTTPPPRAVLLVSATPGRAKAKPGETVPVTVRVRAQNASATGVRVTRIAASPKKAVVGGECPAPFTAAGCTLGTLAAGGRDTVLATVGVPDDLTATTPVTLSITVTAENADAGSAAATVTFAVPVKAKPLPTGTTAAPKKKKKAAPAPRPVPRPVPQPAPALPPEQSVAPPIVTTSVPLPSVQAPTVAQERTSALPQSRLRGNSAAVAQDTEFERVAGVQAAWLAALFVATLLVLTQARLGRRNSRRRVRSR